MSTQIKKTMLKKMMFIAVLLLSLVVAPTSYAVPLTAFGPRDLPIPPGTGFPLWYQDSNGLSLGQCNDPASGFCIFLADEFFNGANPVFPTNWPAESFYYLAETFAGPLFYRVAIETGFGGLGNPVDGQQAVFSRVRFRADVTLPGNYTIRHPYGTEVINVPALGPGPDINQTLDVFGLVALSFNGPLDATSPVGPFLRNAAGNVTDPVTGNVYLANPAASVAITGSPVGQNFVEITDPTGAVIGRADTFNLQGRIIGNSVNPQALTFPAQKVGAPSAAQTVTVTNISTTAPLTVQVTIDGANAADFTLAADGCSNVAVATSGTCTFGVVFNGATPTPAARTASALITTVTPTGMPPMRVALSGTIDSIAPTVTLKIPADGATIPANSSITAVFSEPMLASTITTTTFTLTSGGVPITATVSYDPADNTATVVPGSQLLPVGVGNTATITTGATDAAGNPLAASVVWSFTTVAADFIAPTVASTSPARNSLGVRLDAPIKVTFDDTMNDLSINNATFTLSNGITGVVSFDAATRTATFAPSTSLAAGTAYTATIKGGAAGVNDWAQNTMAADFQFAFVTNNPPSAPALTSPADGATGQATTLTFRWAKAIDNDGDALSYNIEICENSFFIGPNCGKQTVPPVTAAAPRLNGAYFASLGGFGMAVIGLVSLGGIKGRKRLLMLMIAVLLVSGAVISACGTKTDTETVTVNQPSAAEVTFNAASLKAGGTLYFWRVEANDPNGGSSFSEIRSFRTQ